MSTRAKLPVPLATLAVAAALLCAGAAYDAVAATRGSTSLREIRGEVVGVTVVRAEGGLDVVAVDLRADERTQRVLLAPPVVLDAAGFEVAEGDVLRARVFVSDDDAVEAAQRVLNVTRHGMIRLRTFHRDPLWDTQGRWQGAGPAGTGAGRVRDRGTGGEVRR